MLKQIMKSIREQGGNLEAAAVFAAIEVSVKRWTEEDTKAYGLAIKETLEQFVICYTLTDSAYIKNVLQRHLSIKLGSSL